MNADPLAQQRWNDCQASPACAAALVGETACCLEEAGFDETKRGQCAANLAAVCNCVEGFALGYSYSDFCSAECHVPSATN